MLLDLNTRTVRLGTDPNRGIDFDSFYNNSGVNETNESNESNETGIGDSNKSGTEETKVGNLTKVGFSKEDLRPSFCLLTCY